MGDNTLSEMIVDINKQMMKLLRDSDKVTIDDSLKKQLELLWEDFQCLNEIIIREGF